MKKIMALVLTLVCAFSMVGCNKEEKISFPFETDDIENTDNKPEATKWLDGIAFVDLAPGEEMKSPSKITVDVDNSTIQFVITYSRLGLTLKYGLQAEDGTEYSRETVGGNDTNAIKNIPAGTYFLFVRNNGDYSDLPAYQDQTMSFNATGAINYRFENPNMK